MDENTISMPMDKEAFRAWRIRLRLSLVAAARALDRTPRSLQYYEAGLVPIPHVVKLATIALEDHPDLIPPFQAG